MSITIGPPSVEELRPRITVIGVGGAGGNAIANMIAAEIEGVDFIVANTDAQALNTSSADIRIKLGPDITQGLGAGSRPEVGRAAAEETAEEIERALEGVNMCFIAAGMGGGTGTGAAPVIAEAARRKGVLTVGVVTKPFLFEGTRRMRAAEAGIEELQKQVDTLIVIPNQNLFLVAKAETTFKEAFALADEVLQQGVRSITDLMVMPGLINLDFADIRSVMGEMGKAMMGTGEGEGENRALEAAERAIANPLLDGVSMMGAKGVIISIIGGEDMKLLEVDEAANHIRELVDPEANIIWGSAFNPELDGRIRVSVVATGIEQSAEHASAAARPIDLGATRGPKKPVLPIPTEYELAEDLAAAEAPEADEFELTDAFEEEEEAAPAAAAAAEPAATGSIEDVSDPAWLGEDTEDGEEEEWDETAGAAYASLTGDEIQAGGEAEGELDDEEGDWDGVGGGDALELTAEAGLGGGTGGAGGGFGGPGGFAGDDEGDGAGGHGGGGGGGSIDDELLLDASRLAEEDQQGDANLGGRRRGLVAGGDSDGGASSAGGGSQGGGGAGGGGGSGAGSTLFERMANLSRGGAKSDDEEEDEDGDDGSALNIPRFLGRQNNQ